eukprot:gene19308-biopygen5489
MQRGGVTGYVLRRLSHQGGGVLRVKGHLMAAASCVCGGSGDGDSGPVWAGTLVGKDGPISNHPPQPRGWNARAVHQNGVQILTPPPPHPTRPARARATGAGVDARAHNGREALRVRERHHVVAGAVPKRSRGRGRTTLRHCFWASERFWAGHVFSLWRDTSGGTTKACVPEPGQ